MMLHQNLKQIKFVGSKIDVVCAREGGANTTPLFGFAVHFVKQKILTGFLLLQNMKSVGEKIWTIPNPARIPPQTPPAGGNSAEAKRKILSPRKTDFRFAESVLKPHALPRNFLGRTPKENTFPFEENLPPRITKKQGVFSFGVSGVLASAWGFGSFVQFPLEKSSRKVYDYSTTIELSGF